MSFGGGKIKPQDLFSSLKTIQEESHNSGGNNVNKKFIEKFKNRLTENPEFLSA